ncbi:MAG TPA: hypothetical protein VGK66_05830 [Solirubrobacterales bacterium]|nr:hypothetical protein [Solirubrobacterales bacterium]
MADRLRALLDRPLDPSAARAVLIFASAILVGFAALFVLGASQSDHSTSPSPPSGIASSPNSPAAIETAGDESAKVQAAPHRQDPQDVKSSAAARRAARALHSHRALQHVPYRSEGLTVDLVGAHGRRAVLRIKAATVQAARRGWRRFLRRYRDSGRAYIAIFRGKNGKRDG